MANAPTLAYLSRTNLTNVSRPRPVTTMHVPFTLHVPGSGPDGKHFECKWEC
jgi:hypothetical protein